MPSNAVKLYLHLLVFALAAFTTGWLACMVWYHIDPSGLYLYKAIYGTI